MDPEKKSPAEVEGAEAAAAEQPPARSHGITLRQYAILVAAGAFATTFAQQRVIANYPTTFLLKNHLRLGPEQVAVFFFWATFAWNLKPLAGILTDAFPLFGTRRRSYMILGAGAAGLLWLTMAFFPNAYMPLLIVSVAMNVATVFASTVMGGLMVEAGQAFGAPGRISSLRQVVQSVAGIGAPLLGGWLAGQAFGWTATNVLAAVTVLALAVLTFFILHEAPVPKATPVEAAALERPVVRIPTGAIVGAVAAAALAAYLCLDEKTRNIGISFFALLGMFALIVLLMVMPTRNPVIIRAQHQLVQILASRTLWLAVVMLFLVYTVPGFFTALTYRQQDVLKFSETYIGFLSSVEGGFGVLAGLGYVLLCRHFNLRVLLVSSIAVNAAATLLYLVYTRGTALYIHSIGGFLVVLSELALMDLAVRSTPEGCEALGFSLMMSVRNFGIALSDVLGTKLLEEYHLPFNTLIWVNAGATFIILFFIPFLPRPVMSRKEGEPITPEEGVPARAGIEMTPSRIESEVTPPPDRS